jgi:hypothetical protein
MGLGKFIGYQDLFYRNHREDHFFSMSWVADSEMKTAVEFAIFKSVSSAHGRNISCCLLGNLPSSPA